jgi:hypothetical protein
MMIRAERDLQAGEEIVMSYCASPDSREILMKNWQIDCGCPWCQQRKRTPHQTAKRRGSLLKNGPGGGQQRESPAAVEKWIRSLDATYSPEDKFRCEMMGPLTVLMDAYMMEGNADQGIAIGRRLLEIQPRIHDGFRVKIQMRIAQIYALSNRIALAKDELRTMRDLWGKKARITLGHLRVVARESMAQGDPSGSLAKVLRELEEESPAHSS